MKLINGRDVELIQGCILESEDRVYIVCKDKEYYRLLDMEDGTILSDNYSTIDELNETLDYKFRRIVYDGVVTPDEDEFIDVDIKEFDNLSNGTYGILKNKKIFRLR